MHGARRPARIGHAVAATALLLVACGPPVGVRRVSPRAVSSELTESALNSSSPSLFSRNVLARRNLTELFRTNPDAALERLHAVVVGGDGRSNALFALAELSFLHADDTGRRDYYLLASVAAWAFLFPAGAAEPPDPFDPRLRIAADLYNRGLTRALSSADGRTVDLRSGLYTLPFGQEVAVRMPPGALRWEGRTLFEFVPVAELRVRGLRVRYRAPGIGAPLAARAGPPATEDGDHLGPDVRIPVTALLRIDDPRRQLRQPVLYGTLELHRATDPRTVEIDGRPVPLEMEPTAALAWTLSESRLWSLERRGFFAGDLLRQELPTSLTFSQPFRPGCIPVVLVHGTASSAGRWADMVNSLENDPDVRERFQFWFFHYSTGSPVPYSAMLLRDALNETVARLDPAGADPALHQMVVIGHSQGGLLAKLTVVDTGSRLWDTISRQPLSQVDVSPQTRDLLQRALFVEPLPFVRVVVFIATPHRGSFVTTRFLVNTMARFIRLPGNALGALGDLLEGNEDALLLDPRGPRFGSVYNMRPGSPLLQALATTPIAPGVSAHSIIAVTGPGDVPGASDGVVTLESARLGGVESELVIPFANHSVQGHPLAIREVRRILLEHAAQVCRTSGVACGSAREGRRVRRAVRQPSGQNTGTRKTATRKNQRRQSPPSFQ
jgi:pimeloyl-ACP methyl ester carboxylesterase